MPHLLQLHHPDRFLCGCLAIALFNHSFLLPPQSLSSFPFQVFYGTVSRADLQEAVHGMWDVSKVRSAGTQPKIFALSSR